MKTLISSLIPQHLKNYWHLVVAVMAVIYYRNPGRNLKIIGVTGTDGKTTTSTLIYHLLKQAGFQVALISTVAAYIDKEEIDTGFHVTSPDPWSLQKLLHRINQQDIEYVVLEATSHGLDQQRFFGITFNLGVLTNISHEHLDYHKTLTNYARAKAKLFAKAKIAVLNKKEASYKLIKPFLPENIVVAPYGDKASRSPINHIIKTKFPQAYNQLNAAAAVGVVAYLGAKEKDIIEGIKTFPGIKGRMEVIKNNLGIRAIVDFAHTPNALEQVLKALRQTAKGKLIVVYGSAGLRDRAKRKLMGRIGSELADEVILTAEDPRTESVWAIIDEMMSQITTNLGHIHKIPDRQQAIDLAVSLAQKGDTVAVLGKGHEQSMCYGKIEYPWSDQEAIHKSFAKL